MVRRIVADLLLPRSQRERLLVDLVARKIAKNSKKMARSLWKAPHIDFMPERTEMHAGAAKPPAVAKRSAAYPLRDRCTAARGREAGLRYQTHKFSKLLEDIRKVERFAQYIENQGSEYLTEMGGSEK